MSENKYEISQTLLTLLENEHPNILPDYEPSAFDLGVAVGEQKIIQKIKILVNPDDYLMKQEGD